MSSADEIKIVSLKEFFELLPSKYVATASLVLLPVSHVLFGVVPEKISDESLIRDVSWLWNVLNLLETVHILRYTSVHTHYLLVDEGDQGHVIEAIIELLPERDLVSSLDLVEEAIDSRDGLTLVITSQYNDLLWISYLQSEQQADGLAALLTSVNVVTHEKVFRAL